MSSRSSPGGKYIDEMRYAEMIAKIVLLQTERDRYRDAHAQVVMQPQLHDLHVGSKAVGYIGAKKPVTYAEYYRFMREARRLMAKKKYLTPENWEDRRQKLLFTSSDLMIRSVRAPEHPELLPQTPGDGTGMAKEEVGWFARFSQSAKHLLGGEGASKSGEQ